MCSPHFSGHRIFHTPVPAAFADDFVLATTPPRAARAQPLQPVLHLTKGFPDSAPAPAFSDRAASLVRIRRAPLCFSATRCMHIPAENARTQNHLFRPGIFAPAHSPPPNPPCHYPPPPPPPNLSAHS